MCLVPKRRAVAVALVLGACSAATPVVFSSWSAWYPTQAALVYLLTGEEEFARKALEPRETWGERVERAPLIYDWLPAGDAYWRKQAFPAAERARLERQLARLLAPRYEADGRNRWTPGRADPLAARPGARGTARGTLKRDPSRPDVATRRTTPRPWERPANHQRLRVEAPCVTGGMPRRPGHCSWHLQAGSRPAGRRDTAARAPPVG
jgi:hypothetical protein